MKSLSAVLGNDMAKSQWYATERNTAVLVASVLSARGANTLDGDDIWNLVSLLSGSWMRVLRILTETAMRGPRSPMRSKDIEMFQEPCFRSRRASVLCRREGWLGSARPVWMPRGSLGPRAAPLERSCSGCVQLAKTNSISEASLGCRHTHH